MDRSTRCLNYKRQSQVREIMFKVYPRERVYFKPFLQEPCIVQEHGEEKNPRDKLLLADPGNSSSQKSMNSW